MVLPRDNTYNTSSSTIQGQHQCRLQSSNSTIEGQYRVRLHHSSSTIERPQLFNTIKINK